jgi:hypothetical protein
MNRLRKRHHFNIDVKKIGFIFGKCIMCESLKDLISKLERTNSGAREYKLKLRKPLASKVM